MKKLAILLIIWMIPVISNAQDQNGSYNPYVNSGVISPSPLLPAEMNGTGAISFNFGNTGSDALEIFPGHLITLTITLSNGVPDDVIPVDAISGSATGLFSWSFSGESFTGTQIATVNPGYVGTINIAYKVTENSVSGGSNGFNVNITPAPYQNTSNSPDDDAVSSYTYTEYRDYGDAPSSYGSASHNLDFENYLGTVIDGEDSDLFSAAADGDDSDGLDDEDGVVFPAEIVRGTTVSIPVTVTGVGRLYAWIDWNGNGNFEDAGELVADNVLRTTGTANISVDVPLDAVISVPTYARFRIDSDPIPSSTGPIDGGEVEDYQFSILCAPPTPVLVSDDADNTFCAGTPVTFTAGGGASYEFRVGGFMVQNGTSATYETTTLGDGAIVDVIVTDDVGCSATSSGITQNVLHLPVPVLSSSENDNQFCIGTPVIFTAGGGTSYDFQVGGTSVQRGTENIYSTSSLVDGQVVDVVVTDDNGCVNTSAGIINTVFDLPVPTLSSSDSDGIICEGNSVTFTAGGGANYNFRIDNITQQNEASNSFATTSLSDGQTVDVIVTDLNGCAETAAGIQHTVNLNPTASAGDVLSDICQGGTTTALNGSVGGAATGGIWSTTSGGDFSPGATTLTATWTPPANFSGTATLVLTSVGGSCGVVTSESSQVVQPTPGLTITDPDPICSPGTVNLTDAAVTWGSTPGLVYSYWTDSEGTTSFDIPTTAPAGTYYIQGASVLGCSDIQPVMVTTHPIPNAPLVSSSTPSTLCPDETVNLEGLVTSTTPIGGDVFYKTSNNPEGFNVADPSLVGSGNYYIFYQSQEGCYSAGTEVVVVISSCLADVTPTMTVNPNVMNGMTDFNLIVRITELNMENTNGPITINIPKDTRWFLTNGFDPALSVLGGTVLDNIMWTYSEDAVNHIFETSSVIPAGSSSIIGFVVTFDPGSTRGTYSITTQIESGGGGEERVNNNVDSEKIDYFQD